jgi:hypothetical protein
VVTLTVVSTLLFAVAFNLAFLLPEVRGGVVSFNDSVMHLLLTEMAVEAITHGRDFTDPWQGTMSMGFPFFHHYQHLPHITVALVHVLTFEAFPVADMMRWSTYLLLSLFPLSIYWSLRRFGFEQLTAAMGGLVASLAATNLLWGFGYTSYTFLGYGLYTQLWAMMLLPPALSMGYLVLREGRGYFWATLFLAATLLSHPMYGYVAFITLGVLTFIQFFRVSEQRSLAATMWRQWGRLMALFLMAVVVTSYFLVPLLLDREYFNISVHEQWKELDLGHLAVLRGLIEGDLFDFQRFPSLTILVFAGLGVCLVRWREERYLVPAGIFLLWLLLYFGRSTWGPLIDLMPLSQELHVHRFIAGVHLGGIFLAAVALAAPWQWAVSRGKVWYVAGVLALTLLFLVPVYLERRSYLSENAFMIKENQKALTTNDRELSGLYKRLKQLPPGRVYVGHPLPGVEQRWGNNYRIGYAPLYALFASEGLDVMGSTFHRYSLPSDVTDLFDDSSREQYAVFNVRYVVAPEEQEFPAFVNPLQQFGRHHLYQVETTGYFDLVGSDLAFVGGRTDFYAAASSWLSSGLPDVKQHPSVSFDGSSQEIEGPLPLSAAPEVISKAQVSAGLARGAVLFEEVGGNFYAVEVKVERESMLLLKTTYHPNWHATVDGVDADTVMLMPGFLGVRLTPGGHAVRIEYRPRHLRKALLGLGFLTLSLIAVGERWGTAVYSRLRTDVLARVPGQLKWPRSTEPTRSLRRRRRR